MASSFSRAVWSLASTGLLFLGASAIVWTTVRSWRRLVQRVRAGEARRWVAWLQFVPFAFAPLLLGLAAFAFGVAIEEGTARAVVPERAVLLLIPLFAFAAVASAAFAARLIALSPRTRVK